MKGRDVQRRWRKIKSYAVSNKSEEHFIMWCKVCKKSDLTNKTTQHVIACGLGALMHTDRCRFNPEIYTSANK